MLGSGTDGLLHALAFFHYNQRGNAHDTEAAGQLRLLIDVHLADLDVLPLFGDLIQDGSYHPAGAAPAGEEVQKNGLFGIHNLFMEIILVDMQNFHCVFLLEVSVFFFCDFSIPQEKKTFRDNITHHKNFYKTTDKLIHVWYNRQNKGGTVYELFGKENFEGRRCEAR